MVRIFFIYLEPIKNSFLIQIFELDEEREQQRKGGWGGEDVKMEPGKGFTMGIITANHILQQSIWSC